MCTLFRPKFISHIWHTYHIRASIPYCKSPGYDRCKLALVIIIFLNPHTYTAQHFSQGATLLSTFVRYNEDGYNFTIYRYFLEHDGTIIKYNKENSFKYTRRLHKVDQCFNVLLCFINLNPSPWIDGVMSIFEINLVLPNI